LFSRRLAGANKGAHEFTVDQWRDGVHIKSRAGQELTGVLDAVNPGGLNLDGFETGGRKLLPVFARPAENRPPLLLPSSRAILVNRSVFVALKLMPDYE
jgi:hypothetical protein